MKLSVCYIVFNSEKIIGKSISSIHDIAGEIIVVDSFSTDNTRQVCENFPKVKFFQRGFNGFGNQKNHTLSLASGEWILFLDSDEVPDKTAVEAINGIISSETPTADIYTIHFNNILLNKTIRYGGWGNVWRERFFRNGHGSYSEDIVHESFITKGKVAELAGNIDHYTYESISHHISKMNNYTQLMAEKRAAGGKKASLLKIVFSPFFSFIQTYFFKLGFLDGIAGLYLAVTGAFYTFLKYMKTYEIQRER